MYITDNARGKTKAHLENNQSKMTQKKKDLINALIDAYCPNIEEYPKTDEEYEDILNSWAFTNWCYINGEWLNIKTIIGYVEDEWLLDD